MGNHTSNGTQNRNGTSTRRRLAPDGGEPIPPSAIEAEISLLGAMLVDPTVIPEVIDLIGGPEAFMNAKHGLVFQAIVAVYQETSALDLVLLNQRMIDTDTLHNVGGLEYLAYLAEAVPSANHFRHYAADVAAKWRVRRAIETGADMAREAAERPGDIDEIIDEAQRSIFALTEQTKRQQAATLGSSLGQALDDLMNAKTGQGTKTGFAELDELTGGLHDGDMIVIAGRPSMGKSALAVNIAENVWTAGKGVLLFSLEMNRMQVTYRVLSSKANVDAWKMRRGMLSADDFRALETACSRSLEISDKAEFLIDDTAGLTASMLRMKARQYATRKKIGLVVVDYMQLMTAGGRVESRQVEVSEISRTMKAVARELNVPVIALSQLNRGPENRDQNRPRMSDLRESGSIEQDADVIMLLHREAYYHRDDEGWLELNSAKVNQAEVIIAKQRNGPVGTVHLHWNDRLTKFSDLYQQRGAAPVQRQQTVFSEDDGIPV